MALERGGGLQGLGWPRCHCHRHKHLSRKGTQLPWGGSPCTHDIPRGQDWHVWGTRPDGKQFNAKMGGIGQVLQEFRDSHKSQRSLEG